MESRALPVVSIHVPTHFHAMEVPVLRTLPYLTLPPSAVHLPPLPCPLLYNELDVSWVSLCSIHILVPANGPVEALWEPPFVVELYGMMGGLQTCYLQRVSEVGVTWGAEPLPWGSTPAPGCHVGTACCGKPTYLVSEV